MQSDKESNPRISVDTLQDIFGHCGCGFPEESQKFIRDVLQHIDHLSNGLKTIEEGLSFFDNHIGLAYTMYYIFDKYELTEHGSSVPGWLTEKGKKVLDQLNELYPDPVPDPEFCRDACEEKILSSVTIQENGIIRNSKGRLIGRLVEDVSFNSRHLSE